MINLLPRKTDLQRTQRLAAIVRTIPMEWTDSKRWPVEELESVQGLIEGRYRVNTADRVFIVRTMAVGLSLDMLEKANIKDATSFFLVGVRSLLGHEFPEVVSEEQSSEILRMNRQFVESSQTCGVEVEAIYANGKCERTGREFRFEDWIAEPEADGTGKTDCHPLSPLKEKWPGEEYARAAIIRLRENQGLQRNVSAFCRTIAEEQGVPEIATSLKKLLYEPEYKRLWKS